MSILNEVKRIFGVTGKSIEEALSNADPVSGGSGGGSVVVIESQITDNVSTLTKTASEIKQIADSGKAIIIYERQTITGHFAYYHVTNVMPSGIMDGSGCVVDTIIGSNTLSFTSETDDGYPTRIIEN